MSAYIAI